MLPSVISKLILVVLAMAATRLNDGTDAQTVANQCLTEQTRINDQKNINGINQPRRQPTTAEEITMASFDAICNSFNAYVSCFTTRLPDSRQVPDQFLRLLFQEDNMLVAYQGLCSLDLENLRPNIRCLLSTPEVRQCYNAFNIGVNQVVTLQNQRQLQQPALEELACNVSVARYRCETAVYEFCNRQTGEVMRNFFYAGIPRECRQINAVTSRYTAIFNSSSKTTPNLTIVILCWLSFMSLYVPFLKLYNFIPYP